MTERYFVVTEKVIQVVVHELKAASHNEAIEKVKRGEGKTINTYQAETQYEAKG